MAIPSEEKRSAIETSRGEQTIQLAAPEDQPLTRDEVLCYLQRGLWTGVVTAPILRLINGPAVSSDQFVIQVVIFSIACIGAPLLTWWRRRRRHMTADIGNEENSRRIYRTCLFVLVAIHTTIVGYQGYCNAPNLDETAHLPSGLSHWRFGDFTLYRVNPPLIRMWAALPMLIVQPKEDWSSFSESSFSRSEFSTGRGFHNENGFDSFWYFTLARWALLPVTVMGILVCAAWAKELYGARSGLVAATLWCFCPNLIAWAASITPDDGSAAFGILAAWRFWKWLRTPCWPNVVLAGLTLGLAELVKSSWIILFGLWPLLWCFWFFPSKTSPWKQSMMAQGRQLCVVMLLGLYLLNLGYGFEGTGTPLKDFTFISKILGGEEAHEDGGNRFEQSWLGNIPAPVPANYLIGIDVQKYDFERGKWSWLRGEQKEGGWWYYYLYAILVKTPLGFLGLSLLALTACFVRPGYHSDWRDTMLVVTPGLAILVLVSSQTGFTRYLRYVLPAFPFLYLFTSRIVATPLTNRNSRRFTAVIVLLSFGVFGSLSVVPHSMSYFNCAAGGPVNGKFHLVDANIDWGQDLLRMKRWIDDHPDAMPLYADLFTFVPLESAGIKCESIPSNSAESSSAPSPGWYAISVNQLMGYRHWGSNRPECMKFQERQPVQRFGYSIYLYHIPQQGDADEGIDLKEFP